MDEFDQASELEEAQRQASIARTRGEAPPSWWDRVHCIEVDCEEEIPVLRRATGAFRCIGCQQRKETRR